MGRLTPEWLEEIRRLQAIAQTGLAYARDPFDVERYEELRDTAVRLLARLADAEPERVAGLFAADSGYATPKVDVRAVVFREDSLLFVQERSDGLWTLPGGWADVGASPSEAAEKEVREESGYRVRATKLLALYDRDRHGHPALAHHVYKLFVRCELVGGSPGQSLETSAVGFFREGELPELSSARVTAAQVARMFEHHRNPEWPTDLD
jgi:ADP-ribose pyrophosphatase YjhB (NUDIX family)